ncbi:MAG: hypothetical protein JWM95_842 [Gemmatimonadetes bacterium]|nr:hypothetical protein [Gemmatimonadota bacterium]
MRLAFGLLVVAAPLMAQTPLAARIAQAPDGVVRMQFDARPGVCGDGRDRISFRHSTFGDHFESYGRWSDDSCLAGPLRVTLSVAGNRVTRVQTQVGGRWNTTGDRVTDLGIVSPREASAYFFSLVARSDALRDRNYTLLPAVLADDVVVISPLLGIARDDSRTMDTRRQAVHFLGMFGDASVIPALVSFANEDDRRDAAGLAGSAIAALSQLESGAGIPALIELARKGPQGTRKNAVFWLGQCGDPRALRTLRTIISDGDENIEVRKNAIFSLGQSEETPTRDLALLYGDLGDRALKEQAIFALSQRNDNAATDALIRIARDDRDKSMRGKAIFWLGQKHDPRATKLISDLILK